VENLGGFYIYQKNQIKFLLALNKRKSWLLFMDSVIGQKWHVKENKILKIAVTSCGIYRKMASQTFSANFGRSVVVSTSPQVHPW